MPMTPWPEIAGHRCAECGGYATHFYGTEPVCCQCHGGNIISQDEARQAHEHFLQWMQDGAEKEPPCPR